MPILPYRTIALVVAAVFLLGLSFFFGYQTKSHFCEAEGQAAMVAALETAKKQGAIDKKLAEKAERKINETEEVANEVVERAKEAVAIDPDGGCVVDDDLLLLLDEVQSRTER